MQQLHLAPVETCRGEELPRYVTRLIAGDSPHADEIVGAANRFGLHRLIGARFEHHHLHGLVEEAIEQVSEHIAHGNTLVYDELAPLFVGFVEHVERHGAPTADGIDELLASARIPDPADAPLVHVAFRHYALASTGVAEAAQHVLAANIAAVLHEQQRLQHDIAAALDAGLFDVADAIADLGRTWLPAPLRRLLGRIASVGVSAHVERLWADIATQLLMTLDVPGETLHLGRDVPPRSGDGGLFPPDLRDLTLPHLCMLMETWDTTRGTGIGSGAHDWADLRERMSYIVNLFRSRQQTLDLTSPPFGDDQLAAMSRGELPADL